MKFILFFLIQSVLSVKIQTIKTLCLTISCYDTHYEKVFIEMNKTPDYLDHNTILFYNSLYTTIIYK